MVQGMFSLLFYSSWLIFSQKQIPPPPSKNIQMLSALKLFFSFFCEDLQVANGSLSLTSDSVKL
jgi:hypothetical protein